MSIQPVILPNLHRLLQSHRVVKSMATALCYFGLILSSLVPIPIALAQATIPLDFGGEAVGILPNATDYTSNPAHYTQNFATLLGSTIIPLAMAIGALLLLMYLLWGGIEWISSAGDKGKLEKARGRMTAALIGILVLSATIALFGLMQQILGICVINFGPLSCGSEQGGSEGAPACNPSLLSMRATSEDGGTKLRLFLSGRQGSTFMKDRVVTSGGQYALGACSDITSGGPPPFDGTNGFWGSALCVRTISSALTWTHTWKNCAENNCSITSAVCSKSLQIPM